jgi:hypothetical protein
VRSDDDKGAWSPYLAGALSGLVMVLSAWFTGKFFGASTSFVSTAGLIEKVFAPERVDKMEYFSRVVPQVDWQWMFVLGILLGSFIAAYTSGSFRLKAIPGMWEGRFGPGRIKRGVVAFLGGTVGMFGARMAGG